MNWLNGSFGAGHTSRTRPRATGIEDRRYADGAVAAAELLIEPPRMTLSPIKATESDRNRPVLVVSVASKLNPFHWPGLLSADTAKWRE